MNPTSAQVYTRIGWWLLPCALLWVGNGCGTEEIDRRDELGLSQADSGERMELVIVDASQNEKNAPAEPPMDQSLEEGESLDASAVEQEVPGVEATPVYFDPQGRFTVQIGVFSNAKTAREMVRELSAEGYPAYAVLKPDNKATRVRIGYFKTRADAHRFGGIFKQDRGMDFWVDHRLSEEF